MGEDLQREIIVRNPERLVKFTYSQRLNTQLVLDDFLLKKKKGPSWSRGMRKITWRCVEPGCLYSLVTKEGEIHLEGRHYHPSRPDRYARAHARFLIRQDMAAGESSGSLKSSQVVAKVVDESAPDMQGILTKNGDALVQVARRFRRKIMSLKEEEGREDIHGGSGTQIFFDPNDQVGQYFPASSDVKKSPPSS